MRATKIYLWKSRPIRIFFEFLTHYFISQNIVGINFLEIGSFCFQHLYHCSGEPTLNVTINELFKVNTIAYVWCFWSSFHENDTFVSVNHSIIIMRKLLTGKSNKNILNWTTCNQTDFVHSKKTFLAHAFYLFYFRFIVVCIQSDLEKLQSLKVLLNLEGHVVRILRLLIGYANEKSIAKGK